jgi:hypothetical protein
MLDLLQAGKYASNCRSSRDSSARQDKIGACALPMANLQQWVDAPFITARGFAAASWCDNKRRLSVQLCPARCDFHYNATVYD